jgi:hypothetical protein
MPPEMLGGSRRSYERKWSDIQQQELTFP